MITQDQIRKYLEARFVGQRITTAREVKLRCPFHDDKLPSLSFNTEKGAWICHTGCGGGGLRDFEQKLNGGTLDEAWHRVLELVDADHLFKSQVHKPVAVYQYLDAQGHLVFEKLRYEPKRFVQRRPLGDGKFEYKLSGVEKPLYKLPEVITANVAIVTEGEKDADNVAALNLTAMHPQTRVAATCNFDGAGKWSDAYGPYFAGKRVVIVPDNDEPGRAHAELVARGVAKFAAGVRIVTLPGLPDKGDVSDWLAAGHTAADLVAEIKSAPAWRPIEQPHVMVIEGTQFASAAAPDTDWLVKDVVQRGGNGVVIGDPKVAKSLLMIDMLLAIATGTPWLDFAVPRRVRCALISREDYPGLTAQRIANLARNGIRRDDLEGWLWVNSRWQTPTFLLEDRAQVTRLIQELRQEQVEFACFDVFRRLHNEDENDNQKMAAILEQLTRVQSEVGCAIALVHHTTKDINGPIFRRIRGASAIHGWVEWALGVSVTNPEQPGAHWIRKIEFESKAACPADPIYFRIEGDMQTLSLERAEAPEALGPRATEIRKAANTARN